MSREGIRTGLSLYACSYSRDAPSCFLVLAPARPCSLDALFKAAMLPFPIEKGNPRTQVRGIYNIYMYIILTNIVNKIDRQMAGRVELIR